MVLTGFTGRHEGFRRAVAGLRLAERRTDAVLAAASRATMATSSSAV